MSATSWGVAELPTPAEPGPPDVVVDQDGRRAAELAAVRGAGAAVWVGEEGDAALGEFRAEIGRRR